MKCDELKQYEVFVTNPYNTGGSFREIAVLPADKVYEAIAELKAENRKLKRALWLSRLRTLRNFSILSYFQTIRAKGKESNMDFNDMAHRIDLARVKCRAKAEEYGEGK